MAEQTSDFLSAMKTLIRSEVATINTSVEGVVVDYANGLATVRPTATKRFIDGDTLPFPDIHNVPIRWPSFNGGLCGIKGPIRKGDSVLLVFAQQAIDGTDDQRAFDISDAYAIPSGNAMAGESDDNDNMVMWFGDAYIKITKGGGLRIFAPGGSRIDSPTFTTTGNVSVGTGVSGSFTSPTGDVITIQDGIITNIF